MQKDGSEENLSNEAWKNIKDRIAPSKLLVFGVPEKRREVGRSNI